MARYIVVTTDKHRHVTSLEEYDEMDIIVELEDAQEREGLSDVPDLYDLEKAVI